MLWARRHTGVGQVDGRYGNLKCYMHAVPFVTDRVCGQGKAIGRVRLSVRPPYL